MAWKRRLPEEPPTVAQTLLLGSAAAAVGVVCRLGLAPVFGTEHPFITFFPAVLAASIWGGARAGLICQGLCCAAAVALFLPGGDPMHDVWATLTFLVSGGLLTLAGSAMASTVRELRVSQRRMQAADDDLNTLVSELAHRGRNTLTLVMSIIRQSARTATTASELADIVQGRLSAMAEAQDEVVRGGGSSAELGSLLERTLSPFDLDRFIFEPSPSLEVPQDTAAAVALLTHELATNAVKYGALSAPGGRVQVGWKVASGSVRLVWRESGGPAAKEPRETGFGTRLLNGALASHGGHAERRFGPDGMTCEMAFPSAQPGLGSSSGRGFSTATSRQVGLS